jgi:hypothetical protein
LILKDVRRSPSFDRRTGERLGGPGAISRPEFAHSLLAVGSQQRIRSTGLLSAAYRIARSPCGRRQAIIRLWRVVDDVLVAPKIQRGSKAEMHTYTTAQLRKFSRIVAPVYSVRKRQRRCNSGVSMRRNPLHMTGEIVGVRTNPSRASDSNRSCIVSAIIAGVATVRLHCRLRDGQICAGSGK